MFMLNLVSKVDDYLCNKTVDIVSNDYNYFRLLQLKLLLNLQILVQKVNDRLVAKYEQI